MPETQRTPAELLAAVQELDGPLREFRRFLHIAEAVLLPLLEYAAHTCAACEVGLCEEKLRLRATALRAVDAALGAPDGS